MRVDIGRSRCLRLIGVGVLLLGVAAWGEIGFLRGGWLAGAGSAMLFLGAVAGFLLLLRTHPRRRYTRLVLLGHADARLYWRADPLWRWQNARRRRVSGSLRGIAREKGVPADGVDEVCIVERVQWGGLCLWLTVCPRYPDRDASRERLGWGGRCARRVKGATSRGASGSGGTSTYVRLCLPADAITPERFHALCARCRAMCRGAGFLSPW